MAGSRNRRRKMPAFGTFNPFDMFINKIAAQYRLGPKGRSLVRETFDLITEHSGGVGGFVDRFKAAGLSAQVASRLGLADAVPLTEQEVEQALGSEVISAIANKAGASQGFAKTVLAKTIPNIIGLLMECGFSDEAIPPSAPSSDEIAQRGPEQIPMSRMAETGRTPPLAWLVVPGAALLITLGVAGYFLSSRETGHRLAAGSVPVVAQVAPATLANRPAPSQIGSAAAAAPNAPTVISHAPSIIASSAAAPTATAADNAAAQTAAVSPAVIAGPGGKKPIVASSQAALKLPAIYFASRSVKIPPTSKAVLAQVAGQIKQLPGGTVVWISGYTNRTGNPTSNIKLSQRRANAVRQVLVDAGVNPAMLIAKGYGSSRAPISNQESTEGRSNGTMKGQPRVEFRIVQQ